MTTMPLEPKSSSASKGMLAAIASAIASGGNPLDAIKTQTDNKEIAQWAQAEYRKAKNSRTRVERQWLMNLSFYAGFQNVGWVSTKTSSLGAKLDTPKAPPWRVRLVINKVRVMARHEMSTLTSTKPMFDVLPASTEDQDFMAARVALNIFEAVYRDHNIDRELRHAVWWSVITGTGYLKCWWDAEKKALDGVSTGDMCIEMTNPFDVYVPNIREIEIEKQAWVCHAQTKPTDWVKEKFGEEVAANAKATDNPLYDSFLNMAGARDDLKDEVLLLEFWVKPGALKQFPDGGMFTVAGDQIVQRVDQYPYAHNEFPFYKIDGVPSGRYYATSFIEDVIPLQREYNRTVSQIVEAKNLTAKPKLLAQRGSINPAAITSEPGQTVLYEPGFDRPTALEMPPLPGYVFDSLTRNAADMDDISSQHDITRGDAPGQVTAATAISYLQEQDSSKLVYQVRSIEDMTEKLGRHVLKNVNQYWDQPRKVRVVGTDGAFEAQMYSQDDLRGNTDIRVESGSAMPQSKAARQALLMDLLKLGLIEPSMGLDMIGIGGVEKIMADLLVDKKQAQRENMKMVSMPPPVAPTVTEPVANPYNPDDVVQPDTPQLPTLPVNTWDNHQVHITVHNNFRKTQQFEMLDPNIQMIFEQHVNAHQMFIMGGAQTVTPDGGTGPVIGGPPPQAGGPPPELPPGAAPDGGNDAPPPEDLNGTG